MRASLTLVLLCAGCFHDIGALRARGPVDGGPDTGPPEEVIPSVLAADPAIDGAITCALEGLVARGGSLAGLARAADTGTAIVDGISVSSCLRADLVSVAETESLIVSARAAGPVCGDDCGAECGMAAALQVFVGDGERYRHVATVIPTAELADHPVGIGEPIRDVVLCRSDAPDGADNVEIDYLAAFR